MNPDSTALVVAGLAAWLAVQLWATPKRTPIFGWLTKGRGGGFGVSFGPAKRKPRKKGRKR